MVEINQSEAEAEGPERLGWDGKPIPFWLYKLHGLNQEFKCEICGNVSCRVAELPPAARLPA